LKQAIDSTPYVCGLPLVPTTFEDLLLKIEVNAKSNLRDAGFAYCFINSNSVVEAEYNHEYRALLVRNDNNYPDGTPIYIIAKLKNNGNSRKVVKTPGPDVFQAFLEFKIDGVQQYFVGADFKTLGRIAQKLGMSYNEDIFFAPEFSSEITVLKQQISSFLENKPPGLVWLGLGGTKQDMISIELADELPFCFVGVGAGFDFYAGKQKRSPKFMNRLGFEWLFRLAMEPRRLASRYLKGNLLFLKIILKREIFKIPYRNDGTHGHR